jgi:hypothetical protein
MVASAQSLFYPACNSNPASEPVGYLEAVGLSPRKGSSRRLLSIYMVQS